MHECVWGGVGTLYDSSHLAAAGDAQNRENAPNKQVLKLLARAEESAKNEDREAAVRLCLQAYALTKATNSRGETLHVCSLPCGCVAVDCMLTTLARRSAPV